MYIRFEISQSKKRKGNGQTAFVLSLQLFLLSLCLYSPSSYFGRVPHMINLDNYYETNYPVDDTGNSCYYRQTDAPFIFFQNINDLSSQRYCVKSCPSAGTSLQCSNKYPCPNAASSYNTVQVINALGGICEPVDDALKHRFWDNRILSEKMSLLGGYDSIIMAMIIGVCIGLIYLIAMVLLPRIMTYMAFILAFASLLTAAIILIAQPIKLLSYTTNTWNIVLGIFFIVLALCLLIFFFCYQQ